MQTIDGQACLCHKMCGSKTKAKGQVVWVCSCLKISPLICNIVLVMWSEVHDP